MRVRDAVDRFLQTYNMPGSPVYPLFAQQVSWQERPGHRGGDRDALFAALEEVRATMTDLRIEPESIVIGESEAVLITRWSAIRLADDKALGATTIWHLGFDPEGRIVKEHDYTVLPLR